MGGNTLEPFMSEGEDTVARFTNNPTPNILVTDNSGEPQVHINQSQLIKDGSTTVEESFENGQIVTTQDLPIPESDTHSTLSIVKNPRKRCRCEHKEKKIVCESSIIPAWIMAENAWRLSFWNNSKARKVLNTCFTIPNSNNELTCYNMTDVKTVFYVRILCSFFVPQKITIGCRGNKGGKCEFDVAYLDQVVSTLASIIKGAKSKTINLRTNEGKMRMEMVNGDLQFSHLYPNDVKKFVEKNDLGQYHPTKDCQFSVPYSEIEHLSEVLSDTVQFVGLKQDNVTQRSRVFQIAVNDLQKCESMNPTQFAIKLFEIYYSLGLPGGERYPISVVLPEYYKLFSNVM